MVIHLVEILDLSDDVGVDELLASKRPHFAPDASVDALGELELCLRLVDRLVDPYYDLDAPRSIIESVGHFGRLGGDVADLTDEGDLLELSAHVLHRVASETYLRDVRAVDLGVCVRVRLLGLQ